jgi:hypothetical protein
MWRDHSALRDCLLRTPHSRVDGRGGTYTRFSASPATIRIPHSEPTFSRGGELEVSATAACVVGKHEIQL